MSSSATEGASVAGCGGGEKDDHEPDDVDEDDDDDDEDYDDQDIEEDEHDNQKGAPDTDTAGILMTHESRKRFIYCPRMNHCNWVGYVYPCDVEAALARHKTKSCHSSVRLSRTVTCCPNRTSGCFFAVRGDDGTKDVIEHMEICQFNGVGEAVDERDFIACHNVGCDWMAFGFYSDGGDATLSYGRVEVAKHKKSCQFAIKSSRIRRAEVEDDDDDDDEDDNQKGAPDTDTAGILMTHESRKRFIYCPRIKYCNWVGYVYPCDVEAAWNRHKKEECYPSPKDMPLSRKVTCCPNRTSGCFFAVRGDDGTKDVAEHMEICQFNGVGEAVDERDFIACHNVGCDWMAFGFYSDGGDATLSYGRVEVAQHKKSCQFAIKSSRIRRAEVEDDDDDDDEDDDQKGAPSTSRKRPRQGKGTSSAGPPRPSRGVADVPGVSSSSSSFIGVSVAGTSWWCGAGCC
jgi:hypothetical protein